MPTDDLACAVCSTPIRKGREWRYQRPCCPVDPPIWSSAVCSAPCLAAQLVTETTNHAEGNGRREGRAAAEAQPAGRRWWQR